MVSQASIRVIASSESWIEQAAIDQLHQTATLPGIDAVVGLPDLHAGRGIAVGAAFRSHGLVYPHLVGSDIGCGMGLWRTGLSLRKFRPDAVVRKLRGLEEPWAGDAATRLAERGLPALPGEALGTIGGGNHFAELLRFEDVFDAGLFAELGLRGDAVHLMVHSGSRGLGQAILDRHRARHNVDGLAAGSPECAAYLAAHDDALGWAALNRAVMASNHPLLRQMPPLLKTMNQRFSLLIEFLMLVAGMFLDSASAIIVLAPLMQPIAAQVGVDPIHFGIITLVNLSVGMLTPPVGLNLFVAMTISGLSLFQVFRAALPTIALMVVALIVITYVPWFSLALPKLMY